MKGFTLIELMIVIAIICICVAVVFGPESAVRGDTRCIGGYAFTQQGHQIIGQNGGGVPCQ